MRSFSPFDHRQDRELGGALRALLMGGEHRTFVEQVVAGARRHLVGVRRGSSWWDVLGAWSRPGLAAAMAMTAVAVWGAFGIPRTAEADPVTMDDVVAQSAESEEASFLLSLDPPDADIVLTTYFEN